MKANHKGSKLKTLYYFIKPYPLPIVGIGLLVFLYAILEGLGLGILFNILHSSLEVNNQGAENWLMAYISRMITMLPIDDKLIAACALLIIVVTLKSVVGYGSQVFSIHTGYKIWSDNQINIFHKYIESDYLQFLDSKQGEVVYRAYTAPSYLGYVLTAIPQVTVELIKTVVISAMLFSLAFKLSMVVVMFCLVYYFLTRYVAKNISYHIGEERAESSQKQNVLIAEMASGIRQIKLFNAEPRWIKEFFKATRTYFKLATMDGMWLAVPKHLLDFVFMSGVAVILIIAKIANPANFYYLLPIFGIFAYAFMRIMPSLHTLSSQWMQIMGVLPNLEILHSLIQSKMHTVNDGSVSLKEFTGSIKFKDLTFSYPNGLKVLEKVSCEFKKGEQTAIVGASGSGKTTMVDLIIRLFDPTEGSIIVSGINLKDIQRTSWLSKIGYVSQDTFIFNASIAENIAFGKSGVSQDDVEQAARDANAHDFIVHLPKQYDTVVGDRGLKLSGGERQRIAIARALLRKPDILILDEATSALDTASEVLVKDAINRIARDRTVIMIAHRLSTILHADKILVLENGKIVETGTHTELMALNGRYRYFHDTKSKEGETAAVCD